VEVFAESLGLDAPRQALDAEESGFDGIVAVDHFFSARPGATPRWRVEPLVALGAAAAATSRIKLGAMVLNTNFHHPAVIAHAIESLDQLSGGRAELGLGGGWYAPEHEAFGLPWEHPEARAGRLLEAAAVCRAMLEQRGAISHRGRHFDIENSVEWQWPERRPVPVVIGASSPALLRRAATVANRIDLLHPSVAGRPVVDEAHSRSEDRVERLLSEVRASATAARNPIRISATVTAAVFASREAHAARERLAPDVSSTPSLLERDLLYVVGCEDDLLQKIRSLAALGVDRVHVIPAGPEPARAAAAVRGMLEEIQKFGDVTHLTS
jgi:alkanesulfonate monooxygenase SsuD/methylene tetrahydromethanopterin reductase-like flavin-dependent oxidoreductase (luciferase family)